MKIDLHFQRVFTRYLVISYSDGVNNMFEDVDFVGIDKNEFGVFFKRFMHDKCKKVYYCMPDIQLPK